MRAAAAARVAATRSGATARAAVATAFGRTVRNEIDMANPRSLSFSTPSQDIQGWTAPILIGATASITYSGPTNNVVACSGNAGDRAHVVYSVPLKPNTSYVVSADITAVSGSAVDVRMITILGAGSGSNAAGSVTYDVASTGRLGYRFTTGASEQASPTAQVRFGVGTVNQLSAPASMTITNPMVQEIPVLDSAFYDYIPRALALPFTRGFAFASGNAGQIVEVAPIHTESPLRLGYATGDSFANDANDWPQQMQAVFSGAIYGRGRAGQMLSGLIGSNWLADLTEYPYDFAVIQGGVNGISAGASAATILTAVQVMVDQGFRRGLKSIWVLNVSPWKRNAGWTSAKQVVQDDYNAQLAAYCDATPNVYSVDINATLQDPADPLALNPLHETGDGLHPKLSGMQVIAQIVSDAITSNLGRLEA